MPLADECIRDAQERTPELHGMLAIGLGITADAELGAVIESADLAPRNEVWDATLYECIRETALSTILPPPKLDGHEDILITLKVEPE